MSGFNKPGGPGQPVAAVTYVSIYLANYPESRALMLISMLAFDELGRDFNGHTVLALTSLWPEADHWPAAVAAK